MTMGILEYKVVTNGILEIYYNGLGWEYSIVVTKFKNGNVLVTGRTAPNWYNNNNEDARRMGNYQRLLHLENR